MAAHAHIAFYTTEFDDLNEPEVLLYRHWSGYPETVLFDIVPVLQQLNVEKVENIEYRAACLISRLKDVPDMGICGRHGFHKNISFFYAIYPTKIKIFEIDPRVESEDMFDRSVFMNVYDFIINLKHFLSTIS